MAGTARLYTYRNAHFDRSRPELYRLITKRAIVKRQRQSERSVQEGAGSCRQIAKDGATAGAGRAKIRVICSALEKGGKGGKGVLKSGADELEDGDEESAAQAGLRKRVMALKNRMEWNDKELADLIGTNVASLVNWIHGTCAQSSQQALTLRLCELADQKEQEEEELLRWEALAVAAARGSADAEVPGTFARATV
jgi:hypothetical protein